MDVETRLIASVLVVGVMDKGEAEVEAERIAGVVETPNLGVCTGVVLGVVGVGVGVLVGVGV